MRFPFSLLFIVFYFFSNTIIAQTNKTTHDNWNVLLKTYVDNNGNVNYKGFLKDKDALTKYIDKLGKNPLLDSASKNERLAYYINLYNAATVKLILDNYPVKSIKKIAKPWDKEWIKVGNKTLSLEDIEHKILRKIEEPRIHFAVNCAAKSCPPLHNGAWTAENLESNLESSAKKFINNNNYNQITASSAKISSIFDWYAKDFGDVKAYLNKYSNTKLNSGIKIGFTDYNWNLNGK